MEIDSSVVWTAEKDRNVILMLNGNWSGPKDRKYYHALKKFNLVELGGVRRVQRKRDKKLMAPVESFMTIIKDVHDAIEHKGETKTHKKLQETYSNIPMSAV